MIEIVLGLIAIIACWIFEIPVPWAVTITIFSAIAIIKALIRIVGILSERIY